MGKKPVSIIIPVCDLLYYTRQCIESIFSATPEELFELMVVDNGSAPSMQEYLNTQAHRVTCITNKTNLGFARACNQGAEAAQGDYLVFLNNDTIVRPGWLEELLKTAASGPAAGLAGSKLLFPNNTVQHCGIVFGPRKYPYQIYRGCPADLPCVNKPREFQAVSAACMLAPAKYFQEVKGFDENYVNGCEDVDFCLKISSMGYRCIYSPQSVVTHYEGRSPNRQARMRENYDYLLKKWSSVIRHDDAAFFAQDKVVLQRTGLGMGYKNLTTGEQYVEPEGLFIQAKTWLTTGNAEKAMVFFDGLLANDPYNENALKTLGEFSFRTRNFAAAIGFYSKLLDLHPQDQQLKRVVSDIQFLM
ncbi:MAG: glycosyltransferase [Chitinivibrionales bacterium]